MSTGEEHVIVELTLPAVDLATGGKHKVTFQRRAPCEKCDAAGCDACEGGYTKTEASIEVDVPAGSGAGLQIRIRGEGHVRKDRSQGDVVVVLGKQPTEEPAFAANRISTVVFLLMVVAVLVLIMLSMR